ncbi:MAG TPA: rRNA methyltransferase, partial [Microbacterium sp.]|nr:rRNA methyltransferase [Microbacterium sp.]
MQRVDILDANDPRLEDYRDLTDVALRRRIEPAGGLYIAESAKVIARALGAGHRPRSVLTQQKWIDDLAPLLAQHPDVPVYVVGADLAERLTGYAVHRGALAAMHRPEMPPLRDVLREARLVVVLEDIVDHTNVGAIIRCAAGLGFDGFLVTPRCADPLYRRSVRVSMGTVFDLPWTQIDPWPDSLNHLRDNGFVVVGVIPHGHNAVDLD